MKKDRPSNHTRESWREHRRRRFRRHGKRAYIRSAYSLPTLATLGNAVCGFGAIYIAGLDPATAGSDDLTKYFALHRFTAAAYLIFLAMVFDALDGRLARFTRHTTDFGGQLDSLADVISFGVAPPFLALQLFRDQIHNLPVAASRLIWAIGAVYLSCAAMRLARFNVSNEHGEQNHFSFLGLPSPGAAGTVAAFVLMQQAIQNHSKEMSSLAPIARACVWLLPAIVLMTGLLMVSAIRYPHLVNKYLRGKRSLGRVLITLMVLLTVIVAHKYVLAIGTLAYSLSGVATLAYLRWWPGRHPPPPPPAP
jgi:CDP-diacylglycerol--serine O-phosphatidyltransferase